jgi:hypothetical protein
MEPIAKHSSKQVLNVLLVYGIQTRLPPAIRWPCNGFLDLALRSYYYEWIERRVPPLVRISTAKRNQFSFDAIILPEFGDARFEDMTSRLEAFRAMLLRDETKRGTTPTLKAVRNIIDWHLRALWRDAEREGVAGPFPRLDWPRVYRAKPDPP